MAKLAAINPNFVSVTYGAGGSTREGTILTLSMLQQHTAIPVAPHLSCIGSSRAELMDVLHTYKALGVRRIVALRGDLPSGMGQSGDLRYASELVSLIRETTQNYFHIEVAAYPETHPQAKCAQSDIKNLKRKIDAGADSAITQYFYNPDAYFYFLDACAREGINAPVIPGIMPILSFSRLQRFSEVCGAEIPQWMRKRFEVYGDDVESIKAFGIEVVYSLCERLLKGGAPGLHFYTLNQAEPTCAIVNMLKPAKKLSVVAEEQKYVSEPV
jgi:methylenetetrahydrofolate reductase (NADPH)